MATPTLSNLGTQSTYKVYICDGDGAKGSSNGILANLQNTTDIRRVLLEHAAQNRALVYESTTYGYTNQELDGTASAYKYFLSDAGGAEGTVPADALDITPYITNGYKTALYPDANDIALSGTVDNISSGIYTYERRGSLQVLKIDTESDAEIDNLYRIVETNNQIADKDILIIVGTNIGRAITINDHSIENTEVATASQNICLENSATFSTASPEAQRTYVTTNYDKSSLTLMWDATASLWIEINRAPKSVISRKTLRDANINIPVEGTTVVTVGVTGGTTITKTADGDTIVGENDGGTRRIESGVDTSTIAFEGTITTSNAYTVEKPYGSALEGDKYTAVWNAAWTAGSTNVVTIFGQELTPTEALSGSTNSIEITTRYIDGQWEDGKKSVNTDALEPTLPTPTASGQILTSTTANVRSWVDAPAGMLVASATYDFAVHGGGTGTKVIGVEVFPINSIILADHATIEMHTALSEASGTPTVSIGTTGGVGTDVDAIDAVRNFNATPYSSATAVTRTAPGGSVTVVKSTSAVTNITVVISSEALDAGKFTVHVPYIA